MNEKTILLVDDEEDTHEPFQLKFEQEGFRVLIAADGLQAWDLLTQEKPEIMILDVRMPKLGGEELLERMQKESASPKTQVIIATGVSDYGRTRARILGRFKIAHYLEKPLVIKDLLEKVRALLAAPAR